MSETPEVSGNGAPGADFIVLYLAARILKTAGFDAASAAKVLREVYGVEVEPSRLEEWLSTLPEEVRRRPVLRRLVQTLTKDKLQALRYLAGAALGDADRYGELEVKDLSFARAYANALSVVTGDPDAAVVTVDRDGMCRTKCCRLVGYIRDGLWKVLAYLDKFDKVKYFLSGLLDADGALSPHICGKGLRRFQITFTSTDKELAEFVKNALEELGLSPRIRVEEVGRTFLVNGKMFTRKRPLWYVHVDAELPKIDALARSVELHCERKRKLLEFLYLIRNLKPSLRYELFARYWMRERRIWLPREAQSPWDLIKMLYASELEPTQKISKRPPQHRATRAPRTYIIECPVCKQPGTLVRQKNGTTTIIHVIHEDRKCELISADKCPKCGRPGRLEATADRDARGGYKYVKVRVEHRSMKARKWCHIMRLPLIQDANQFNEPRHPNPHHRIPS